MTPSESRTNQLWATFAGMFGAERLARTFGKNPPREWVDLIGNLKDYELQRGVRRVMASGTDQIPTLPKFRRFCQESRNDDVDAPQAQPLPQLPSNLASQDDWDIRSNLQLMKYIYTRLGKEPTAYGPIGSGGLASEKQRACTDILVRRKKQWARLMRESADSAGTVDSTDQRELWESHMKAAEEEIGKVMAA